MPAPHGRLLVLCFDGTDNSFDGTNTNIVKLFNLLKKDDKDRQMVYYQPGVGTYIEPGMMMHFGIWFSKLLDLGFATYLDSHIMGGYRFLMDNYNPGDRICMFGFSRGAYTARCLAGMLNKVGLLPKSNMEQVTFAYQMYKNTSKKGWKQSAAFKRTFGQSVVIDFVGCFETISSVGAVIPRHLPFSTADANIKTFRQALSLDEHRFRYLPNMWHRDAGKDESAGKDPEQASRCYNPGTTDLQAAGYTGPTDVEEVWFPGFHSDVGGGNVSDDTPHSLGFVSLRWMIAQTIKCQTRIMYIPGSIESLGFESTPFEEMRLNAVDDRLSRIPGPIPGNHGSIHIVDDGHERSSMDRLADRVDEAKVKHRLKESTKQDNGATLTDRRAPAMFDSSSPGAGSSHQRLTNATDGTLIDSSFDHSGSKLHKSTHTKPHERDATYQVLVAGESNAERQQRDVMAPAHDQLKILPIWWLVEILPMIETYQDDQGKWHNKLVIHFGRGREIRSTEEPTFHISVKERMEAGIGYKPRARMLKGTVNAKWTE